VPGCSSQWTARGGEGGREVTEGSRDVAEGNREVEDSTRKRDEVEGRTAKGEAIAATLGESDRH
jgi:hypothetical protein